MTEPTLTHPAPGADLRLTAIAWTGGAGPCLLEWVAWQRMIGFTDLVVYHEGPDDGSAALLEALAEDGWLTAVPMPRAPDPMVPMLHDARGRKVVREAAYCWLAPVDEFLSVRVGDGSVAALMAAAGWPDAVSVLPQRFACTAVGWSPAPVTARFTRTHNPDLCGTSFCFTVRSLWRPGLPLLGLGLHRPALRPKRLAKGVPLRWCDGGGQPVPEGFIATSLEAPVIELPATGARSLASIAVYPWTSLDSFLIRSGWPEAAPDEMEWQTGNDDSVEDRGLQARRPALEATMAELMERPGVARAQEECLARWRARIERLRATPGYAETVAHLQALPRIAPGEAELMQALGTG